MNFLDIPVNELTEEEINLIRLFRNMHGLHGTYYAKNSLEFTDGIATTWILSECHMLIDVLSKLLHWEDDDFMNYIRKRSYIAKAENK